MSEHADQFEEREGQTAQEVQAHGDPTQQAIEQRAYEISQGPYAGTAEENWLRAERELRGGSA